MIKKMLNKVSALLLSVLMIASLMSSATIVHAEDTTNKSIIPTFTATLSSGATLKDNKYVWNITDHPDTHKFIYRINYELSSTTDIPAGGVKITIPKSILKDRDGNPADIIDVSVPSEEEAKSASQGDDVNYTWTTGKDKDGKDVIVISNITTRKSEDGFIEVSYSPTKSAFDYVDMQQSDPFQATITVNNETKQTDPISVVMNTQVGDSASTTLHAPTNLYKDWQSSWGTQPNETQGMHFLVWDAETNINNPTQPYTLKIENTPVSSDLQFVGYSLNNANGPYTTTNQIDNQTSSKRHDYILTYYDPAKYKDKDAYSFTDSVKTTLIPKDTIDSNIVNSSKATWRYTKPTFIPQTATASGYKYGDHTIYENFKDNEISDNNEFSYTASTYAYSGTWTANDSKDPDSYGKKNITYMVGDDKLYLNDNITSKNSSDFTIPKDAKPLGSDDYQVKSAKWSINTEYRYFNDTTQKFERASHEYSEDDIVHFEAEVNGAPKEVATYNLGTKTSTIYDDSIVESLNDKEIVFKDNNVTGIRLFTSNAYWYTDLSVSPVIHLKNSKKVTDAIKNDKELKLHNISTSTIKSNDKTLFEQQYYAYDRAVSPEKHSSIKKEVVSTGSNKVKKKYTLRWKISPRETLTTNSGTTYIKQKSGTFYDLLPKGLHLEKGSINVITDQGSLDKNSFSYKVTQDYRNSGRDMVKITIPVAADFYDVYLNSEISWDAIKDYGDAVINPVAYETGNDDITNGFNDDGGNLTNSNKQYMTSLDSKCSTKRFLYDESKHNIDTITSALSGLKKQVKSENDTTYTNSTYVASNGGYSYRLRYANTMNNKSSNLVFFDSLENYQLNGKGSDWHGIVKRFDLTQLRQKGVNPVIYVSTQENLSMEDHHDLTDTTIWQPLTDSTDLTQVHAFAIDCRKMADGKDFELNEGESLSAVVYMQAPDHVNETENSYAKAYNNIYIQSKIISGKTDVDYFNHEDYTTVNYHTAAPLTIHKQSTQDASVSVTGATYTLTGTSAYNTKVNESETTGEQGNATFESLEKGTYTLKETSTTPDWFLDQHEYTVKVDKSGVITIDNQAVNGQYVVKDAPRIHGDISFMKYSTLGNTPAVGTKFRLSGTSEYGTDVMEYATADNAGKVTFSNIEYGHYTLKEVSAAKGFIPSDKEYTATISDAAYGGIVDAELLTNGMPVIRNEPYHTVQISKQSAYDGSTIEGATFNLSGTSNYGHLYNQDATSGGNGIATFDQLESGTYILKETQAPKDFELNNTQYIVKVNQDGTYTIDGLNKNENKVYRFDDIPKLNGKIVVKKVWKDNKTNDQRKTPVIRISTDVDQVTSYAVWRDDAEDMIRVDWKHWKDFTPFYYIDQNTLSVGSKFYLPQFKIQTEVKKIQYSNIPAAEVPKDATRLDENFNDDNAKYKIYGWLTGDGTLHYWSNAQKTILTDHSRYIFSNLQEVESIDLSHIDTSEVTDMSEMFYNCKKLSSLDFSNFNTSNVTDMSEMFSGCNDITTLDLEKFDTSNVRKMKQMFWYCQNLVSLNLPNSDTTNLTDMGGMFGDCYKLESLDLRCFDTSKVTDMHEIFANCEGLKSLDLSNFDTSKVTNIEGLFWHCSNLTNIYVSDKWNMNNVDVANNGDTDMFYRDEQLFTNHGLDVAICNTYHLHSKEYAHYGTGGVFDKKDTNTILTTLNNIARRVTNTVTNTIDAVVNAVSGDTSTQSATYVSTDPKQCTIHKDGDTWTYEFHVVDPDATYYATEDFMGGYTSSLGGSDAETTKNHPLTITNTASNYTQPASFNIKKSIDGKHVDDLPVYEKYAHTSNIDDTGKAKDVYNNSLNETNVVTIPGASRLHVELYYSTESTSYDWACVWAGNHSDYNPYTNYQSSQLGSVTGKIGDGNKSTSYNSASVLEGDINGDAVTFGFRSDSSGGYYGYYAVVTGYDQNNNPVQAGVKKVVSDTNAVDVPNEYQNKTYMFNVTLSNSDSSKLAGTKIFGNTVFKDGTARVGIKPGETLNINGLPAGTTYKVEEDKYADFNTESNDASGTANATSAPTAVFTNHYQKPTTNKKTNDFTLKNTVKGYYQSVGKYTYNVSFKNLTPDKQYKLDNDQTFTADHDGYGYVSVILGDKEAVKFNNLDVGASYKVTQQAEKDTTPSYKVTNATDKGDIAQSSNQANKNESLATAWENVDEGEDITVTYINNVVKYQNLVLKNTVTGKAPDKFHYVVTFTNLPETIQSDAGNIVPDEDRKASVDVYLDNDETITFKNVPVTTKYQITEYANAGTASYQLTSADETKAKYAKASKQNTKSDQDLQTALETVDEGEDVTVTYLNVMPEVAHISLTKKVQGLEVHPNKFFKFTISLTNATKNQNYSIDLSQGSEEHDGMKNPIFIKTDNNGHASVDIYLKQNDKIVVNDLPLTAKYSIAEDDNNHKKEITVNGNKVENISERNVANEDVVFTNTFNYVLPTGFTNRHSIAIICAVIIITTLLLLIFARKKIRH